MIRQQGASFLAVDGTKQWLHGIRRDEGGGGGQLQTSPAPGCNSYIPRALHDDHHRLTAISNKCDRDSLE